MPGPRRRPVNERRLAELYSKLIAAPLVEIPAKGLEGRPMQQGVYVIYSPKGKCCTSAQPERAPGNLAAA